MRRTIEEVVTLYDLEPTTRRDVYVEGECDRELISWYFSQQGEEGRSVFSISNIEVPVDELDRHGLQRGSNRDRVLAMALSVWESIDRYSCRLCFVVDSDLSEFVLSQKVPDRVLTTDFPAADGYLLNDEILDRFIEVHCKLDHEAAVQFRDSIFEVTKFLYAFRVVLATIPIFVKIVGVERLLTLNNGSLIVDQVSVVRRTLSSCGRLGELEFVDLALKETLERIERRAIHVLHFTHGHDALAVLGEAIHLRVKDSAYRQEERVRRSLLMGLRIEMLRGFRLFTQLEAA